MERAALGLESHGRPTDACDNAAVSRAAPHCERRLRRHLGAILVTVLAVGCGNQNASPSAIASPPPSTGPTPAPTATPKPEEVYAAIKQSVIDIRGLQPKRDIDPQILDETELGKRVKDAFNRDNPPEIVRANERLLKGLDLLPEDASLATMFVDMQSSQVAGYYDPDAKELFVVSRTGGLGPTERVTFAHEFTHALQDQNFDLNEFDLAEVGQGDRGLARLSLIEGDATAVMTVWVQQHLNIVELLQLTQEASDPEALPILEELPPIIREGALFPYDAGLKFVLALQSSGGEGAVDGAFKDPPASSEQIMHFEKYEAHEKPVAVAIPTGIAGRLGNGWKESLQDTLGEFQLGVWLRQGTDRATVANDAAAGWGGDRVALYEGPNGAWGIVLMTAWDSEQDARDFSDAAAQTISKDDAVGGINLEGRTVTVVLGSDGDTRDKVTFALR
jgi:hypothetical protein